MTDLKGWRIIAVKRVCYDIEGLGDEDMLEIHGYNAEGLGFEVTLQMDAFEDMGENPILNYIYDCLNAAKTESAP